MKKVILSLIVLHTLAFQCDPGTGIYETHFRDMEIITGIQIRSGNGTPREKLGNPNSKGTINAFPNPVNTLLRGTAPDIVRKVWYVPGEIENDFQSVEYDVAYEDFVYPTSDIEAAHVRIHTPNSKTFAMNLTTAPSGFYRVFFLLDSGEIYWDNIYIDHERTAAETISALSGNWD